MGHLYRLVVKICRTLRVFASVACISLAFASSVQAENLFGEPGIDVFSVPAAARALERVAAAASGGRLDAARQALDPILDRAPDWPEAVALDAIVRAGAGDAAGAAAAVARAAALGFADIPALLAIPPLAALGLAPDSGASSPAPPPARTMTPARAEGGDVLVGAAAVAWRWDIGMLEARVAFPPPLRRRPPVMNPRDESRPARMLHRLVLRGDAAGNLGDLYVNRDRGHSALAPADHPQLTFVRFDDAAKTAGVDYGLNDVILFDAPTIANSSTAIVSGALKRSLPRLAMTDPGRIARVAALYGANQFHVYPSTEDHNPDRGDRFPAITPYMLVSQGASGTDRPFLKAAAMALAAMRSDTKTALKQAGLVAPTLQMLLRRAMADDQGDAAYLAPEAHPSAFDGRRLDLERLVMLANGLRADEIPPAPTLRMIAEHPAEAVGPIFADGLAEVLFTTPAAVARIFRAPAQQRIYRLGVTASDPNDRPLRFHWRVLRGDPARVRVKPLTPDGMAVEVVVTWRDDDVPAPGRSDLASRRVDVAVFADNGANLSAPAFFSVVFPPGQSRRFDAAGRVLAVDHRIAPGIWRDADPLLFPLRDWRDEFFYGENGAVLGWRRVRDAGPAEDFTRHGLRIVERDARGRTTMAEAMAYPVDVGADGRRRVRPTPTGALFSYVYDDDDDRLGSPTPVAGDAP